MAAFPNFIELFTARHTTCTCIYNNTCIMYSQVTRLDWQRLADDSATLDEGAVRLKSDQTGMMGHR